MANIDMTKLIEKLTAERETVSLEVEASTKRQSEIEARLGEIREEEAALDAEHKRVNQAIHLRAADMQYLDTRLTDARMILGVATVRGLVFEADVIVPAEPEPGFVVKWIGADMFGKTFDSAEDCRAVVLNYDENGGMEDRRPCDFTFWRREFGKPDMKIGEYARPVTPPTDLQSESSVRADLENPGVTPVYATTEEIREAAFRYLRIHYGKWFATKDLIDAVMKELLVKDRKKGYITIHNALSRRAASAEYPQFSQRSTGEFTYRNPTKR